MTSMSRALPRTPHHQRGVVLFIALIAMVILSLAGVALMRSVDTSLGAAGNLAFRNSSLAPVNQAIEETIKAIFKTTPRPATTANDATMNYFVQLQAGESKNGVPALLAGDYYTMTTAYTGAGLLPPIVDAVSGTELRWIVERVCNFPAVTQPEIIGHCDILPPKVTTAGTDNKCAVPPCLTLPPIPVFRVTVRADIPNTNAVSYAQAFLR